MANSRASTRASRSTTRCAARAGRQTFEIDKSDAPWAPHRRPFMAKDQRRSLQLYKYALYVSLVVVILRLSWQFLAALVRHALRRQRVSATSRRAQDVAFSSCPEALQIYAPVLDVDGFILNAAAGVDKVPHRHLPLYGVAHQARHKVMHLLGATKKRDKMKRPKPVAPVFDLERLLRTCLKEDRSRVARDNLDLVAYWPPSDKSCRPKCRRFQNDRDLGKNWEDIRACLLADLAQLPWGPVRYRTAAASTGRSTRRFARSRYSGGGNLCGRRRKSGRTRPSSRRSRAALTWCVLHAIDARRLLDGVAVRFLAARPSQVGRVIAAMT